MFDKNMNVLNITTKIIDLPYTPKHHCCTYLKDALYNWPKTIQGIKI